MSKELLRLAGYHAHLVYGKTPLVLRIWRLSYCLACRRPPRCIGTPSRLIEYLVRPALIKAVSKGVCDQLAKQMGRFLIGLRPPCDTYGSVARQLYNIQAALRVLTLRRYQTRLGRFRIGTRSTIGTVGVLLYRADPAWSMASSMTLFEQGRVNQR